MEHNPQHSEGHHARKVSDDASYESSTCSDHYKNDSNISGGCSMLDKMPSRTAFWAGVVTTLGVVFAAGFIFLLVMMAKGAQFTTGAPSDKVAGVTPVANTNTVTPAANANTAVVNNQVSGKVDVSDPTKVRGSGDIVLVEYSDTECPYCKRFHTTLQDMLKKYDGKVKWVYKHMPLEGLHQKAKNESIAVECASEQGKFWEYIDEVYAQTPSNDGLDVSALYTIADKVQVDRSKFDDCLKNEKTKARVEADIAEGEKLGINGTPTSYIADKDGNLIEKIADSRGISGAFPLTGGTINLSTFIDKYVK